jgi:type VI secretion system protein ImpK
VTGQQLDRLRDGLRRGCPDARFDLAADTDGVTVRLLEAGLFAPGSATVQARFLPVILCIAAVIDPEPGAIMVTGHTDNVPIKTLKYPSNWELSDARAKAVAGLMTPLLADPQRIAFEGLADTMPLAPNTTVEDRERNRRIDVMLRREDIR